MSCALIGFSCSDQQVMSNDDIDIARNQKKWVVHSKIVEKYIELSESLATRKKQLPEIKSREFKEDPLLEPADELRDSSSALVESKEFCVVDEFSCHPK